MKMTVIEYVLSRLRELGVTDVFGVPGDYAFPLDDAVCADKDLRWIGTCNELNAAYAADGYARVKGVAAVCTTYGVGELSAINGVGGAYTEYLPIFHLVGMPVSGVQKTHGFIHHTLGNGEFDLFYKMTEPVVCARAIMTPENCVPETERLIAAAMYYRRPVYMAFPGDYANAPIRGTDWHALHAALVTPSKSDSAVLEAAVDAIVKAVSEAKTACILPGIMVARFELWNEATAVVDASGLPFATMLMDKGVLDETHSNYIGMYDGRFMDEEVRVFVEGCDCVLGFGALLTDFNSGAFTAKIDRSKSINVMHHHVRVGLAVYSNVEMKDVLTALAKRLPKRSDVKGPKPKGLGEPKGAANDKISAEYLYPRLQKFLKPGDILVAETGTVSIGLACAALPRGSTFQNQTLWAAIGWATPAAFGAALAAPKRRLVLVTGDGSHQLTAQEVGQFYRFGLKPIIFVLNNSGYLTERLLCKDGESYYNDLANWNYQLLPEALGCADWFTARAATCGELDQAIQRAESSRTGAYIEIVANKYMALPLA
jgi:indolepyruvate decarboxylase